MLPDYLAPNLEIVFVGLNPGEYSDRVGHYFARPQNAFWAALSKSGIVPEPLTPSDDARITQFGLGLTDLVKRASKSASQVSKEEFVKGGRKLRAKLEPLAPRVICFVGLTGYRAAFDPSARLGAQSSCWGKSRLFIIPSTSARNARYRKEIVHWFKELRSSIIASEAKQTKFQLGDCFGANNVPRNDMWTKEHHDRHQSHSQTT